MTHFFSLLRHLTFCCIAGFFLSGQASLTMRNIDQTYQILPPHLKHYSITNGAILWETGWINNFYRFANFYPLKKKGSRQRIIISCDPLKTDAVTQLIHLLFYRVPGSTSYTDFSTTDLIRTQNSVEIAKVVAEIVVNLSPLNQAIDEISRVFEALTKEVDTLASNPTLIKNRYAKKILDNFAAAMQKVKKTRNLDFLRHEIENIHRSLSNPDSAFKSALSTQFIAYLEKYSEAVTKLDILLVPLTRLFKFSKTSGLKVSSHEFANIVAHALQECQPPTQDHYPPNLIYSLFLAFLWKALDKVCGADEAKNRKALQIYYAKLGDLLGQEFKLPAEVTLPKKIHPQKAAEEFFALIEKKPLTNSDCPLDSVFFYATKIPPFPPLEGFATIKYQPPLHHSRPVSFPDCMENSIANFIRIMSYDLQNSTYSISTLEMRLGITLSQTAHDRLAAFFNYPFDHEGWGSLVSNIAYVPYLSRTPHDVGTRFIRIEDVSLKSEYENNGYVVIDPNQACFELRPSTRTIILVLNHVLDLGLFKDNLGRDILGAEALRPDFVTHYFSLLCKKLHLQGGYAEKLFTLKELEKSTEDEEEEPQPNKIINRSNISIDTFDYTGNKNLFCFFINKFTDLKNSKGLHQFATKKEHGQYIFDYENKDKFNKEIIKNINNESSTPFSFEIALIIMLIFENNFNLLPENLGSFYNFFAAPLYNPDIAYYIAQQQINLKTSDDRMKNLSFYLAQSQPDVMQRLNLLSGLVNLSSNEAQRERIQQALLTVMTNPRVTQQHFAKASNVLATVIAEMNQEELKKTFNKLATGLLRSPYYPQINLRIMKLWERDTKNPKEEAQLPQLISTFIEKNFTNDAYTTPEKTHKIIHLLNLLYNKKFISASQTLEYIIQADTQDKLEPWTALLTLLKRLSVDKSLTVDQQKILTPILEKLFNSFGAIQLSPQKDYTSLLSAFFDLFFSRLGTPNYQTVGSIIRETLNYLALTSFDIGPTDLYFIKFLAAVAGQKNINNDLINLIFESVERSVQDGFDIFGNDINSLEVLVEKNPSPFLLSKLKELYKSNLIINREDLEKLASCITILEETLAEISPEEKKG